MAMKIKANVADLKDRLSEYLKRVENGDEISVCKRNVPIARIEPVSDGDSEKTTVPQPPSLSDVTGWLDDDDPFFRAIEERRSVRGAVRRVPFS